MDIGVSSTSSNAVSSHFSLTQTEMKDYALEDLIHESNKPLARYADDADLDAFQQQIREFNGLIYEPQSAVWNCSLFDNALLSQNGNETVCKVQNLLMILI